MFGRRKKDDEDPFAALREGGTYQSATTTAADIGLSAEPLRVPSAQPLEIPSGPPTPVELAPAPVQTPPTPVKTAASPTPTIAPPAAPTPTATASSFFNSEPTDPTPSTQRSGLGGPRIGRVRRRRPTFGFAGWGTPIVIRIVVLLIALAAIGIPLSSIKDALHSVKIPDFGQSSTSPGGQSTPGSRHVNYLQPRHLRAGLARIKGIQPGARLSLLRVDSESMSTTASGRRGSVKQIYFGPSGTSITSAASTGQRPIPISQINPDVVGSLVAEMGRRFHVPARRIDYLVLTSPPGLAPAWILFTKAPSHPGYEATLGGANLRRLWT